MVISNIIKRLSRTIASFLLVIIGYKKSIVLWLPWRVLHSTRGYCDSPGTVGTADGYCRVLWVLQGTVGTVRGYCTG